MRVQIGLCITENRTMLLQLKITAIKLTKNTTVQTQFEIFTDCNT